MFYQTYFFAIFFGPGVKYMYERSLRLSLHIPKRFNAFQALKWFSLLLEVTCVIFARATNTDLWQAIVARATKCYLEVNSPYLLFVCMSGSNGK